MIEGLQEDQLEGALESLLFVSDSPVDVITLANMLETDAASVEAALKALASRLEEQKAGIQLVEAAGGWRLYTNPVFDDVVSKYVLSWDTRRMSQASLEVLAIVAYSEPVTRAQISSVRGVGSDTALTTLIERGYVREVGTAETPGNPVLYGTTHTFLERFGLRSVNDLPPIESFAPDEETKRLIRERLGALKEPEPGTAEDGLEKAPMPEQPTLSEALRAAAGLQIATGLGTVEKIDFDSLIFDTDDDE